MTEIRFRVDPRLVPPEKVARRLGVSLECFKNATPELEASGFPRPINVLGNYCLQAVDNWIDSQSGLTQDNDPESARREMMAAIREARWAQ